MRYAGKKRNRGNRKVYSGPSVHSSSTVAPTFTAFPEMKTEISQTILGYPLPALASLAQAGVCYVEWLIRERQCTGGQHTTTDFR